MCMAQWPSDGPTEPVLVVMCLCSRLLLLSFTGSSSSLGDDLCSFSVLYRAVSYQEMFHAEGWCVCTRRIW